PDEGGAKGYQLLVKAMRASSMVGLARFVMRQREHLVALRVMDDLLVLHTLHYADEVLTAADLEGDLPAEADVSKKEIDVAGRLIEAMSSEAFDPGQYQDDYMQKVKELIEKKS